MTSFSRIFKEVTFVFSRPPFYTDHVCAPMMTGESRHHFFQDAVGAMDGCRINIVPPPLSADKYRDYKGRDTQNCLFACDFNMRATYVSSGWEGSTADSAMFNEARRYGLPLPVGKYYLADAGFPSCDQLLVPYRGVRYGLNENATSLWLRQVTGFISSRARLTIFSDPKTPKNYSIFGMRQHAMSSSGSLAY
jgi:hypothetical protein